MRRDALKWASAETLGLPEFDSNDLASNFSAMFTRTFGHDPNEGRRYIQYEIDGKSPDLGYYLLAQIIATGPSRLIVTTNFDNHAADALSAMTPQYPLIVGHEVLAGYVEDRPTRPTIIKLHRDLFYEFKAAPEETTTLDTKLALLITRICRSHPLIVIGYGANDGSLMDVLDELPKNAFPGGLYWCWYRHGVPISSRIEALLEKQDGFLVEIDGFNEMMTLLLESMREEGFIRDLHTELISRRYEERMTLIGETMIELQKRTIDNRGPELSKEASEIQRAQERLVEVAISDPKDWWQWVLRARQAQVHERRAIFEEALKYWPRNPQLLVNYAYFLAHDLGELELAERNYKRAIEVDDSNAYLIAVYAVFLEDYRGMKPEAKKLYEQSLEMNPEDSFVHLRYAQLLDESDGDPTLAEEHYRHAIRLRRTDAYVLVNFAKFLSKARKNWEEAEDYFKLALHLEPDDSFILCSYAIFLLNARDDADGADKYYSRACTSGDADELVFLQYAEFLEMERKDYSRAESLFQMALEVAPDSPLALAYYGRFLARLSRDIDKSRTLLQQAKAIDPQSKVVREGLELLGEIMD